jgi:hypothetical protein
MPWFHHALFPESKPTPGGRDLSALKLGRSFCRRRGHARHANRAPPAKQQKFRRHQELMKSGHQGHTEVERRSNSAGRINAELDGQITWKRKPHDYKCA